MLSSELNVLTISELSEQIQNNLTQNFTAIWLRGEISNLVLAASGHAYFSVKDEKSQLRCVMFRGNLNKLQCELINGLQVILKANLSVYTPRGDLQLIADYIIPEGIGNLQIEFDKLKQKLKQEGLFAQAAKQSIPKRINTVAVITSLKGAALFDVLHVLKRRQANLKVLVYPSSVQGSEAHLELTKAVNLANQHAKADVILLVRGGGSMEDLFAFNKEELARAIYSSKLPIITGVGHETDFTIADFVADLRAPTPSAAAEMVSVNLTEYIVALKQHKLALSQLICNLMNNKLQKLDYARASLIAPKQQILHYLERLKNSTEKLHTYIKQTLHNHSLKLMHKLELLHNSNPANLLQKGFSYVTKAEAVITNSKQVKVNDDIEVTLHQGRLSCKVTSIK